MSKSYFHTVVMTRFHWGRQRSSTLVVCRLLSSGTKILFLRFFAFDSCDMAATSPMAGRRFPCGGVTTRRCQVFPSSLTAISELQEKVTRNHGVRESGDHTFKLTMADTDSTTFNNQITPTGNTKENDPLETAKWTRYLPETFGIREAVRKSSYRWCVREGCVS